MKEWAQGLLDEAQATFVESSVGAPHLIEDFSWGLVDSTVLRVRARGRDFVVKAAGPGNHHIAREITAHESYTAPLIREDLSAVLVGAERSLNVLITTYQRGDLVEGTEAESNPDIHRQAGVALRALHGQCTRTDEVYEKRMTEKAIGWLDRPHRIDPSVESEVRRVCETYRPLPVDVAPTHGDWQPRNWLSDGGKLRVIDFGRFDFRPPSTDLCRLAVQQWRDRPALEAAFLDGYGDDPRDETLWRIDLLREAVGTAAWAFQVGDNEFEAQGHRMLVEALEAF